MRVQYFVLVKVIMQTKGLKLRRLDCTMNDLKSMGVKRWRKKAKAVIMKEALVEL